MTCKIYRSCQEENIKPLSGNKYGLIPNWISGSLVQNGPGRFSFGSDVFKHLFDGSALVRKFKIADGEVSYQCQFVKTESYKVYLCREECYSILFALDCGFRSIIKFHSRITWRQIQLLFLSSAQQSDRNGGPG